MISSVHVKWFQVSEADKTVRAFKSQREQIIATLLSVFQNRTTENFNRCGCAYYLGEMRASEAAAVLASDITLELDYSHILVQGIPLVAYDPAFNAVVKIGTPAIPALIRNLAGSDDGKIRGLSLKALYGIEGDKDVVRLRLQKALKAEARPQNQRRLELALKALEDTTFGS